MKNLLSKLIELIVFLIISSQIRAQVTNVSATILRDSVCPLTQGYILLTEFYNTKLDHYFYTTPCYGEELNAIEAGFAGPGWLLTGRQYSVRYLYGTEHKMCRFYGSLSPGPNSHLYVFGNECDAIKKLEATSPAHLPRWNYESTVYGYGFQIDPIQVDGRCVRYADNQPEYIRLVRLYNNGYKLGKDSNHRFLPYSAFTEIKQLEDKGWINEGPVFCVLYSWKNGALEP